MEVENPPSVETADAAPSMKIVPETLLKKRKRDEQWAINRKEQLESTKKAGSKSRTLIFKRAEQFIREYRGQEADLTRLKREAKLKSRPYVEPESKLMFVIRIRGVNDMHPKTRKIMQVLRLKDTLSGVFIEASEATMDLLRKVEPYVNYGYPSRKSVRELIYKRGHCKQGMNRTPLTDNGVIEQALGKFNIICIEDLVHEIYTIGPHFSEANNFLWPFRLSAPLGGVVRKRHNNVKPGDADNREEIFNTLISQMT